ncbi:MAG: 50S ribosomal protein L4 [Bacilli bacterium]|nr:50S ribosomal protein L4 [Bacilli bacterium]
MKKIDVLNIKGEKVKDIKLAEEVFGITPNDAVLYDALMLASSNARQGTHSVKSRAEVSGGGRKPWKQKGTGRARQGSTRAPHWYHGGVAFGPQTETNYTKKQNRKERRLALKSALSYKVLDNELIVLDELKLNSNKTKEMKDILNNLKVDRSILVVVDELDDNVILATRNLNNVLLLSADEINTMDIVSARALIATEAAVKTIEEALK